MVGTSEIHTLVRAHQSEIRKSIDELERSCSQAILAGHQAGAKRDRCMRRLQHTLRMYSDFEDHVLLRHLWQQRYPRGLTELVRQHQRQRRWLASALRAAAHMEHSGRQPGRVDAVIRMLREQVVQEQRQLTPERLEQCVGGGRDAALLAGPSWKGTSVRRAASGGST